MTIVERLREIRIKRGVPQREIAKGVGVSRSTVSRWECRGRSTRRRRWIKALGATHDDLSDCTDFAYILLTDLAIRWKIREYIADRIYPEKRAGMSIFRKWE